MRKHIVKVIMLIACCATLCGCNNKIEENNNKELHEDKFSKLEVANDSEVKEETMEYPEDIVEYPKVVEDNQEQVDEIQEEFIGDKTKDELADNILIGKDINSINTNDVNTDTFSDILKSEIVFGEIEETDVLMCYAIALEYLGNIEEFEHSEWLSNTRYTDAYPIIFLINGEHYKFVISSTTIYMTDQI